jgi:hypothetical protein
MRLYELYKKTSLAQEEPHAATLTPSPSETAFPGRVKNVVTCLIYGLLVARVGSRRRRRRRG